MKIDTIKLNTGYYMPNKGSKLTSFRGESQATNTLPAQGQDVVQLTGKTETTSGEENNSKGSTIHNMFISLKHFFTDDPSFDNAGFDDLDSIIYRSITY